MRNCRTGVSGALLWACLASAQLPAGTDRTEESRPRRNSTAGVEDVLGARVKSEWEALKNKDKQAFSDLLADEFVGVEADDQGTRTKAKAVNELDHGNIYNYSLFGLSVVRLGPDAALATYEVTMEFPRKAQSRYLRVYVSEIWINRDGTWKLRHYQETHVR